MREYKSIPFEDLKRIAEYMDEVSKLFPVDSIPSLKTAKEKALEAMTHTYDAGNEGLIHAKLDLIMVELDIINGRAKLAEEVAGPLPNNAFPGKIVKVKSLNRVPRNLSELEADLPGRDLEFDNEGGGHE